MVFLCKKCGKEYSFDELKWKCTCGGYLILKNKAAFTKDDIKRDRLNLWRYDKAYAIPYEEISITYDEGLTPLSKLKYKDYSIRLKMDSLMPTGSFKDRGAVMAINYLKNHGITKITEDSSGNSAAAVAAYCALGQIECDVYVPAGNSSGKIMQAKAYGAAMHEVEGTREDVALAAQKNPDSYAGHNWHPMYIEGYKSAAYELWEQNGFKAPEIIITPCGGGGMTLGLIKGFKELLYNKQIEKMPRIFAVQPENCNPIYRKFHGIDDHFSPCGTIAEGTAIAQPVKADEITEEIRNCQGSIVSVSEEEIKRAVKEICRNGFYIEPTSSIAAAALFQLIENGILTNKNEIVLMITGSGLKTGYTIEELLK